MVKRPSKKTKFDKVMDKAEEVGAPQHTFGHGNKDGTANIDPEELEKFREKVEKQGVSWTKVKFVAMNAPFMRRSSPPQA